MARAAGTAAFASAAPAEAPPMRTPNVILIYTDDQGSVDLNVFGAKDLETPNMDALAKRGVRFTQFYAPSPVCSPSRAGLMTGRYPVHAGVPGNCPSTKGEAGMPTTEVTIAEMLKAAGYATAHVGKWHLGYSPETMPNQQGFDYSFGHMGGCIDNYSHFFYWHGPNRHDLHENGQEVWRDGDFFPDLMVDAASRFMEEHREEPFFVYFAINQPHYPYQGEPDWLDHYRDKGVEYPRDLYAAFISTFDERIGTLLAKVDALGLRNDTIVIFQSDHGHSTEERAHYGGGSAGPYRGAKFSLFEGGIRVPAAICWPGHIPEGEVREQLAHGCDWLPTIADLCGVPLPDAELDGLSLRAVIESPDAPTPHDVVHWQVGLGPKAQWAVRHGDWKLIGNPRDTSDKGPIGKDDTLFLSNLPQDIGEMANMAKEYPEVVERLVELHEAWLG
ncbi:MAG TPA: DUF229 domain-containing protein [Candidatus Hydrogenedentes bacterium]|nr:DUF229 domain-containing protein [Candidatus Hydrogenedentota bacterium]